MIPKVIHYCWFGHKPLPKSALSCINSWKLFFPDYQIKEWNENNFDLSSVPYVSKHITQRNMHSLVIMYVFGLCTIMEVFILM